MSTPNPATHTRTRRLATTITTRVAAGELVERELATLAARNPRQVAEITVELAAMLNTLNTRRSNRLIPNRYTEEERKAAYAAYRRGERNPWVEDAAREYCRVNSRENYRKRRGAA